ncbi:hypothetical protein HYALB_00006399 [Hymenoscyphus albidus]|uniref:Carboxylic ester hydrolase n=1 Tax=Hymenoscyphus albidus TaxID=595503 RepID=A0A9N9PYW3_9HELO|nr:hypothetical protein HYALB_00006399 [Hymenoscyphus albidus]
MSLQCVPSTFGNIELFGAQVLAIDAKLHENWSLTTTASLVGGEPIEVKDLSFCNVTVTYTHPGQEDNLKVEVWLPPADVWNKRLMATGGGGYVAGGTHHAFIRQQMTLGLSGNFAVSTRDAGLGVAEDATRWGLLSEGNVNLYALQNLAGVSLDDESIISKKIISDFYSDSLQYSYWSGCSQGGRQGMYQAQSNPTAYDGILAIAPAINWNGFFLGMFWPQLVMNLAGEYPYACELDVLNAAAVKECDGLDGVLDGVISDEELCGFDPFPYVGKPFNCSTTGKIMKISKIAAKVADATWKGPRFADGKFMWHGLGYDAHLNEPGKTECSADSTCFGVPQSLVANWISLFIARNPGFDLTSITHEQFGDMHRAAFQRYASMTETANPDLSKFKATGGKILTWHGIDDQLIPWNGTKQYYDRVTSLDPDTPDFFRVFAAPGIQHCGGGKGGFPGSAFEALVNWVENGKAPDTLPVSFTSAGGETFNQVLCPYPAKGRYDGVGDPKSASSFRCVRPGESEGESGVKDEL